MHVDSNKKNLPSFISPIGHCSLMKIGQALTGEDVGNIMVGANTIFNYLT